MNTDPSTAKFVVEVSHPFSATDQHDWLTKCDSVEQLAIELDEVTGWGSWTCLEIAVDIGRGEDFEHEFADGKVVTVRRRIAAPALVGGRG